MTKWYPKSVYSFREDITRENMRKYNERQAKIYKRCLELAPDFHKLGLRQQVAIRDKAKTEVD